VQPLRTPSFPAQAPAFPGSHQVAYVADLLGDDNKNAIWCAPLLAAFRRISSQALLAGRLGRSQHRVQPLQQTLILLLQLTSALFEFFQS